ncbi:unnamed protein product [Bursaphelenchus xylophilus]|uniref:(pine wood nematode) hypothetical protein n=1 Tax=Bursaphelenchus xylophilus TaxID=6326 RepID=A0A7I8X505_BURXY|nr:unnamed protein product [Bursaphelenchus xylophilus]CAG9122435.1 unnamed protein product [Bursaphelenchus xylophilus]
MEEIMVIMAAIMSMEMVEAAGTEKIDCGIPIQAGVWRITWNARNDKCGKLCVYFVIRVARLRLLHINFRITVCNTIIALEVMHITYFFGNFYDLYTSNFTDRFYVNIGCAIVGILNYIGGGSSAVSMLSLAVERHMAYKWSDVYEDAPQNLGKKLAIFVWFCSLSRKTRQDRFVRLNLNTLSARYQTTENSYTVASITPSMAIFLMISSTSLVSCFIRGYIAEVYGENTIASKFLADLGYFLVDIYALCHLMCIWAYNPMVRRVIQQDFTMFSCCRKSTPADAKIDYQRETQMYFDQFRDAWK